MTLNVWDDDNNLILKEYEKENYEVIDISNNPVCLVFFSSHAVYYPNTEEEFVRTIKLKIDMNGRIQQQI